MQKKIIATPPGPDPNEIREAWAGVEIPVAVKCPIPGRTGPPRTGADSADDYQVYIESAIEALQLAGRDGAVRYWEVWEALGKRTLIFKKEVCELVD